MHPLVSMVIFIGGTTGSFFLVNMFVDGVISKYNRQKAMEVEVVRPFLLLILVMICYVSLYSLVNYIPPPVKNLVILDAKGVINNKENATLLKLLLDKVNGSLVIGPNKSGYAFEEDRDLAPKIVAVINKSVGCMSPEDHVRQWLSLKDLSEFTGVVCITSQMQLPVPTSVTKADKGLTMQKVDNVISQIEHGPKLKDFKFKTPKPCASESVNILPEGQIVVITEFPDEQKE